MAIAPPPLDPQRRPRHGRRYDAEIERVRLRSERFAAIREDLRWLLIFLLMIALFIAYAILQGYPWPGVTSSLVTATHHG